MSSEILSAPFEVLTEGMAFETRGRTVTEADVVAFSAQTGDWHPQHADADWAARSAFGERVAHGMLVLSYAVGLVDFDPARVLALRRISDAVFKRPVRLGDTIRVHGQVAELRPVSDEAGLATLAWTVVNQEGETVVRARVEALWARDGAPPASETESGQSARPAAPESGQEAPSAPESGQPAPSAPESGQPARSGTPGLSAGPFEPTADGFVPIPL
ncbi:MAG TPA: MaoC/PaaZ C-terminal domain-containing protein [Solirubrobacteraceae bacterium]|nr:MaoC/PaaZ C-terminal domain-containing protein [Solirubrobacteraceae bacterium]